MSKKLKAVIIGIDEIFFSQKKMDKEIFFEFGKLISFLKQKNITPVILANRSWSIKGKNYREFVTEYWGEFPWFVMNEINGPRKPLKAATEFVLENLGLDTTEVVYLGNTIEDMKSAINGGILFLNATWYRKTNDYGIIFDSPLKVGQFIETFCLREHIWHHSIVENGLEYYSLSPYSTYKPEFATYSTDAKNAAKWGLGHPDFWTKYLWSSIYFSDIYKRINFIATYPGHQKDSLNVVMQGPLEDFAKCFNHIKYLPDLINRHTTSVKSSQARARGRGHALDHLNQLNTIRIEQFPQYGNRRYKNCPLKSGKTILVVDDICTEGYSLEAARMYLKQTGANIIVISWLKTINSNYHQIKEVNKFNPFHINTFQESDLGEIVTHNYHANVIDHYAPEELDEKLAAYDNWNWPEVAEDDIPF